MCILAWNWQPTQSTPLLLLANRDEFYARPTQAAHWWNTDQILAGRDLQAGGTWLGISPGGRLAALTNYRLPVPDTAMRPSRGTLVADFLRSDVDANSYLQSLAQRMDAFQPFNLLVYDGKQLMGLESRHQRVFAVAPGIGAVSNADFGTSWPKLLQLKNALQQELLHPFVEAQHYLPLLQNPQRAPWESLPNTGIERTWEHALSAIFIAESDYGTRASSIVCMTQNSVQFLEQSYGPQGPSQTLHFSFDLRHIAS